MCVKIWAAFTINWLFNSKLGLLKPRIVKKFHALKRVEKLDEALHNRTGGEWCICWHCNFSYRMFLMCCCFYLFSDVLNGRPVCSRSGKSLEDGGSAVVISEKSSDGIACGEILWRVLLCWFQIHEKYCNTWVEWSKVCFVDLAACISFGRGIHGWVIVLSSR